MKIIIIHSILYIVKDIHLIRVMQHQMIIITINTYDNNKYRTYIIAILNK